MRPFADGVGWVDIWNALDASTYFNQVCNQGWR